MERTMQITMKKFYAYLRLMRMDRPIGAFLLLWPTMWALWLAGEGQPDPDIVIIFVTGTFLMRAAGCAINDYADRKYDSHVKRTKNRPLVSGELTMREAIGLFLCLLFLSLLLVLQLNRLAILLSLFAVFISSLYPFTKRFTQLPQCVLGVAFSWGIPMAYAALTNTVPPEAWWIFAANFCWIVAYDTQYAMVDRDDDIAIGIKSTAILFGRFDNLMIGFLHLSALMILSVVGWSRELSWHYYLGLGLAGGFAVYQQYLCRERARENCFRAFLNNNWFGAMVFFGIVLSLIQAA